ncbi:HEAT repeat domain-containing protein [Nostoc sp. ATCC 53789]|uniref:HEAT repeat domain-containing protein n=1 Tax=Nostoc sp. ATCC 53789 TaxID=76335 RepID=UPI0015F096F9|nr:HEAT repeat domain-containing protein [Nostoc sp. ATCC 53789]
MTSTEGVNLQVDDVYVPLGLVERKKVSKRQGDVSPEQGSELYKETEITKTFEHNVFLDEVLKQKNTPKSQGKRIAIIGEPGAGKTTLLQQIADWVSREIHQSIVIWVSLADLRGQELKSYLFETWLTQVAEKIGKAEATKQLKDNFVALFNQKNVWLLLDGLDEISASNPLTEIARQFREGGLISQVRIVLTCRVNLWDGSINALDDFDIYRSLDFSYPEQVERFIHRWFAVIPETGKQLCTALKESGKERIQDLVKNPLRLTLLCLNWQSGDGKLPDTQAGLYQQFVDDFDKWKKAEFATTFEQRQQLNVKLGELAKAAIDKEATRFRLRQGFVTHFLGDADDENSLLKLALNRGWLNCVGVDTNRKPVYAFFHASFQEYFAAKAINDWHFFLNHVPKNPSQGTYRIFEPQWKQTILLWLGREEENLKNQKQQFMDSLVIFKDECGKLNRKDVAIKGFYEYRAYFLAAAGIAEFRGYSRANEIVTQIVKWNCGCFNKQNSWKSFFKPIEEETRSALQQINHTTEITAFVQLLQSKNVDKYIRSHAAKSLGQIGTGNKIAIAALVQLLQSKNVDKYIRSHAAKSLGQIDPGNKIAIAALVQLLQSKNVDKYMRSYAVESLGQIGTGNKIAIAALMQLLQSKNVDKYIRSHAAKSLGQIDPGNKIAIAALMQLLQSKNVDKYIRSHAAKSLGQIGTGNEIVIAALMQLLQSTTVDNSTRSQAADSLGEIGTGNEIAIAPLVELLQSKSVDDYTRRLAISSLGRIDPGNNIAISALVELLQSQSVHSHTLWLAADSLGRIDPGNNIAIAALVELLQSQSVHSHTRWRAADSLGRIDPGNDIAIAALVELLQSQSVDDGTRMEIADRLGRIDPGNDIAIAALVELLQSKSVRGYIPWQAVKSLGIIGIGNDIAIAALVELLQSKSVDISIHNEAANSLEKILQNNKHRFKVVKSLSSDPQLLNKYYDLAWKCAQNMPYPNFYQAWHQHNVATRTMQSLKKILFPKGI